MSVKVALISSVGSTSASMDDNSKGRTIIAIILVSLGVIGFGLLCAGLTTCSRRSRKSSYTRVAPAQASGSFVRSTNTGTLPPDGDIEMQTQRLLEAKPPPTYEEALTAPNATALAYSRSPSISYNQDQRLLYPPSPLLLPSSPASPEPTANSPLHGYRYG